MDIFREMNLSETAYITPTDEPDSFGLRWWTPGNEVALCGHATLASTAVLSAHPRYGSVEKYRFQTLSGELTTKKINRDDGSHVFELDFPATVPEVVDGALQDDAYTVKLRASLGSKFKSVKQISRSKFDIIVEVELEDGDHLGDWDLVLDPLVRSLPYCASSRLAKLSLSGLQGDMKTRGVCFTTLLPQSGDSEEPLFHSRFFAPKLGVKEDPVTGTFWSMLSLEIPSDIHCISRHIRLAALRPRSAVHQEIREEGRNRIVRYPRRYQARRDQIRVG